MSILLLIATLIYCSLLVTLLYGWFANPEEEIPLELPPISVLVAAHDEAENLPKLLDSLLQQDYPTYEVILVLDRCSDQSGMLARTAAKGNFRLKVLEIHQVPEGWSPKKWALEQAVAAAQFDHFALTDADCRPGPGWLKSLAGAFAREAELVLGTSPYIPKPGLLNKFIRFETLYTALLYVGAAGWGAPYMGVGRNIAYTRSFFKRSGGQAGIKGRLSGDDDLLVNAHALGRRTVAVVSRESVVPSIPKATFSSWLRQKKRHLSASGAYSFRSQAFLAMLHGAHLIFYVSLILVLCTGGEMAFAGLIFLLKTILNLLCFGPPARQWKQLDLLIWYPLLDLLFLGYLVVVGPVGKISKPKW
ncbi:MAG: glycosyltransferase [Bacteroidia bacterium]|nr:glycosyltransferase [Bacteroidia bacterium]